LVGAAYGLGTQAIGDVAGAVAPNHPWVRTAAEFGVPLAADLAGRPMLSAIRGEGDIAQTATTAAGAEETKVAGDVTTAQKEMEATRAKADNEMAQKMVDFRTKAEDQVAKDAHREAVAGQFGAARPLSEPEVTLDAGGKPVALPAQSEIEKQTQFREAGKDIINRSAKAMKNKFRAGMESQQQARRAGPAAEDPAEVVARMNAVANKTPVPGAPEDPAALMARLRSGEKVPVQPAAGGKFVRPLEARPPAPTLAGPPPEPPTLTTKGVPFRPQPGTPPPPVTAAEKAAAKAAETAATPADRVTISGSDVPAHMEGAHQVWQSQLGSNKLWQLIDEKGLHPDTVKYILENQQVGVQMARGATDAQKFILRQAVNDYVEKVGVGGLDKSMAPTFKAMGFTGPLTEADGWVHMFRAQDHLADTLSNSPAAQRVIENKVAARELVLQREDDAGFVKAAQAQVKTLPAPLRARIEQAIIAAPEGQKGPAALEAFRGLDPQAEGGVAGRGAGISAIQGYKPSSGFLDYMKRYALRRALWSADSPKGIIKSGLMLGGLTTRELLRSGFIRKLENPAEAARYYDAILDPSKPSNLDYLVDTMVDSAARQATLQAGRPKGLDQPPPPGAPISTTSPFAPGPRSTPASSPFAPGAPGPMSKAIEQKQAVQIASESHRVNPAHVENIQSLHKDISSGKSPNVQRDLEGGRLAQSEIRKMVEPVPANVGSMFTGMNLADAMEVFQRGTPEEKAMGFPAIAQKMNDEGRDMQPVQRRQMLAQLRRALPEEGDVG
jgi:hypothetical protein